MDDELIKLFFEEMRDWRASVATKDDVAALRTELTAMRTTIGVRFDALTGEVSKLAELVTKTIEVLPKR